MRVLKHVGTHCSERLAMVWANTLEDNGSIEVTGEKTVSPRDALTLMALHDTLHAMFN